MAVSSKSKKLGSSNGDVELLKSDVASFASSIGLSSSLPTSGFDDTDFRKTGPIKKQAKKPSSDLTQTKQIEKGEKFKKKEQPKPYSNSNPKPKPKPTVPLVKATINEKYKNLPKLPLVKATAVGVWYVDLAELEEKVIAGDAMKKKNSAEEWKGLVEKKKQLAERLMAQYTQDYELSRGQTGDIKMLVATQRSGTAADKVSAFTVMVGDNPIANLRSLDALLGMVSSKIGKRHALAGFEALKELFISSLLPDRKLKTLFQRPLNHLPESKDGYSLLLFWYWEECLKQRYERFVSSLEEASQDVLAILKDKALKTIYTLLKCKSEQERRLLTALVNKLGDPENKSASNADFHLSKLLSDHPNMKAVVIEEVDNFLFRPHLGLRAKYHAVNFLSQIRLTHNGDGPKVAKRLIDVYFALFKVLISEGGGIPKLDKDNEEEHKKVLISSKDNKDKSVQDSHVGMDSRLLTALLTGVNRAFPYVSSNEADDVVELQTPMLFQLVHSKNFNVGVQALMLLDKISSKNQIVSDRFYRALYSKLLLPAAMNSSKEEMFIGLLLRAMKSDINLKRVAAFSKRLLQVALQQPPQYACGCLFLLSEVLKARPPLWNMVLQNESVDEDLEHFEDIEETENQTDTKSEKIDNSIEAHHQRDDKIDTDNDDSSMDEDESQTAGSEDNFSDEEANDFVISDRPNGSQESKITSDLNKGKQTQVSNSRPSLPGGYNPRHREPSYCNAECASWWELMILAAHVHPSVSTMASTLLSGAHIVYNGNPLSDLSLTAFLDKFMEKKPKQSTWHGPSEIEPAKKLEMNHQLIGAEILSLAETEVPPEDFVFHKFYMNKMGSSNKSKKKKKKKATEDEAAEELFAGGGGDDDDDSDNEEIDNMLDSINPSLKADGDYDYDDLDKIADEDDDDLVGNASDDEMMFQSGIADEEEDATGGDDDDNDEVIIGHHDDDDDDVDSGIDQKKRRKKSGGRAGASPFASLEDYEHLLKEEGSSEKSTTKSKSRKKRKMIK